MPLAVGSWYGDGDVLDKETNCREWDTRLEFPERQRPPSPRQWPVGGCRLGQSQFSAATGAASPRGGGPGRASVGIASSLLCSPSCVLGVCSPVGP